MIEICSKIVYTLTNIKYTAVIVPHMGSATVKTRIDMSLTAAQNILNGLEDKPLVYEL